jgi:uncharacterized C2H2 Zn-finger protein
MALISKKLRASAKGREGTLRLEGCLFTTETTVLAHLRKMGEHEHKCERCGTVFIFSLSLYLEGVFCKGDHSMVAVSFDGLMRCEKCDYQYRQC